MKEPAKYLIDVEIDGLTNSIVNTISGDSFSTDVLPLRKWDFETISKNEGWLFDWKREYGFAKRELFKLTILGNLSIVQGILSISDQGDHFYVHLVESAPFNLGKNKLYIGVPGNLFAFACKISKEKGYGGFVAFTSKTKLIEHYRETLGAVPVGAGPKMIIFPSTADNLIKRYF